MVKNIPQENNDPPIIVGLYSVLFGIFPLFRWKLASCRISSGEKKRKDKQVTRKLIIKAFPVQGSVTKQTPQHSYRLEAILATRLVLYHTIFLLGFHNPTVNGSSAHCIKARQQASSKTRTCDCSSSSTVPQITKYDCKLSLQEAQLFLL